MLPLKEALCHSFVLFAVFIAIISDMIYNNINKLQLSILAIFFFVYFELLTKYTICMLRYLDLAEIKHKNTGGINVI